MADDSKPPQEPEGTPPEQKEGVKAPAPTSATSPTPSTGAKPPVVAKPPAVAPKAPPPAQTPWDNELVRRYRERFGDAIMAAMEDRKQAYLVIDSAKLLEIARYSRDEEKFDLFEDFTAVDWPKREKRFDLIAVLYSFAHNMRLRLKIAVGAEEKPASVVEIWPTANWLEREIFDMFGIEFAGHPDMKRILLPDGWQGHPLRKDYDILQQDTAWVRENLGIESGQ